MINTQENLTIWSNNKKISTKVRSISGFLAVKVIPVTFEHELFVSSYFLCIIEKKMISGSIEAFIKKLGNHLKINNQKCLVFGSVFIPDNFSDYILCINGDIPDADLMDLISDANQQCVGYKKRMAGTSFSLMSKPPVNKRIFRCLYLYRELSESKTVYPSEMAAILQTRPETIRRDIALLKDFGCHMIKVRSGRKQGIRMVRSF